MTLAQQLRHGLMVGVVQYTVSVVGEVVDGQAEVLLHPVTGSMPDIRATCGGGLIRGVSNYTLRVVGELNGEAFISMRPLASEPRTMSGVIKDDRIRVEPPR